MKILNFTILILMLSFNQLNAQIDRAITYNLRLDVKSDNENNWHNRKEKLVAQIAYYAPDVLGTQEGLEHQLNYMDSCLIDYSYIGVGRDDGKRAGEYSAIFYNNKKLKVLTSNTFWLSPTPEKVSIGWDAAFKRVCTYALFENLQDHKQCWVFNTHFDHIGQQARIESMSLIIKKIEDVTKDSGLPVILMGDFNITPENIAIANINKVLTDSYFTSKVEHYGPDGTFNGFKPNEETTERIDYIFIRGLQVLRHAHIDDRRNNNLCISDHYPVYVEFN